ncbi:hypothetical protein O988_00811 [Pseudogymnoascus sp. VKM F-3808]|nr:hypothetical protein O988_00811 [Pseudogymnoascus sp. VKM F-3808]
MESCINHVTIEHKQAKLTRTRPEQVSSIISTQPVSEEKEERRSLNANIGAYSVLYSIHTQQAPSAA